MSLQAGSRVHGRSVGAYTSTCDSGQIVTITASGPPRCPLLIDVRTAEEWSEGDNIGCASWVQSDADDLVEQVMALAAADTSQPIVTFDVMGDDGLRTYAAEVVRDLLLAAGFSAVISGGGIGVEEDVAALEAMCDLCTEMCPADVTVSGFVVNVSDLLAILEGLRHAGQLRPPRGHRGHQHRRHR